MKLRLLKLYDILINSYWFLPSLMAIIAGVGAIVTLRIDSAGDTDWLQEIGWFWAGGPDGARSVLSTIAGSVMTVVSIVFSITIATLAQTSAQYGPRVLRNFTSDWGNQFVLGAFIATFIYSLLVLRTVRSVEENQFVPYLSVNIGIALAMATLAVLIYFIHHVTQRIQVENVIADIGHDFAAALPRLFPKVIGQPADDADVKLPDEVRWAEATIITAPRNGYLQRVDDTKLMQLACDHDLLIRLEKRPGDFVIVDTPLLRMLAPAKPAERWSKQLQASFTIGINRTPYQDVGYSLQQAVEIAALALSPGVNEPFTAITCIDWLGTALRGILLYNHTSSLRHDKSGQLRVIAQAVTFGELTAAIFDQIRIYGSANPAVVIRLLEMIASQAPHLQRDEDRYVLIGHIHQIGRDATANIANEADKRRAVAAYFGALCALEPL